jgi:dCMP deaminase
MTDWDSRFMDMAKLVATWSKDRSRQTACVIVGTSKEVVSVGYNGFPRGIDDTVESRHERPAKYQWTEHAERNAIYNAVRCGISTLGCTAYLPWYPCADCARALIQAGVSTLVAYKPDFNDPKWGDDFRCVEVMLNEAGLKTRWIEGTVGAAK